MVDEQVPAGLLPAPSVDRDVRRPPTGRLGRLTLRARLTLLLAIVAALLLATLSTQIAYQTRLTNQRSNLVHRVARAEEAAHELSAAVMDQESGLRDFALTGDDRFLARDEEGREAADQALSQLDELVGDSDRLASDLDGIRGALARWRRLAAEPVGTAPPRDPATIDAFLARSDAGFAALRAAIDGLDAAVEDERADGVRAADRTSERLRGVMILQAIGVVVLGMVIAVALYRQVLAPLARLGRDARAVADGDLARSVGVEGPPELVLIGEDVEAMRARIVAELRELITIRAELERQAAELARSNADLEQFAYVASHDLQEPLRKVSGFCQLLERRYGDQLDDRAREYIAFATDGAQRMQVLINALLAFSRVGRTTEAFEPVDLRRVATEVVDLLAEPIEASGATVTIGDLPTVDGDRRLLTAVFQNLIGNAIKFRSGEPLRVVVTASPHGEEWTIMVSDNGIGVDAAYADQIFTLFGRLHHKTDYDGTGIGLALAKRVIEFHGGRIWLEATPERGATFAFTLPSRSRDTVPSRRSEIDEPE